MAETRRGLRRPALRDFASEGEATPLLLQKRVIVPLVVAFAVLVAGYFVASRVFGFSTEIDAEPFQEWVERRGPWGPVVFVVVMAASVLFAPIPNAPIFVAAGLAWGPVLGTAYSMAGLMLGSLAAFYVSRYLGRRWIGRLIGTKATERLDSLAVNMGGRVIFWARMLPAVNFDWISFLAGVTSIGVRRFAISSFLGMLLPTAVTVVAGDGLGRDFRITIAAGSVWLGAIVLSALYFWWSRRHAGRTAVA